MCPSVCPSLSESVRACVRVFVRVFVRVCVRVFVRVFVRVCPSLCPSRCPSLCPSRCPSLCPSRCPSRCPSSESLYPCAAIGPPGFCTHTPHRTSNRLRQHEVRRLCRPRTIKKLGFAVLPRSFVKLSSKQGGSHVTRFPFGRLIRGEKAGAVFTKVLPRGRFLSGRLQLGCARVQRPPLRT